MHLKCTQNVYVECSHNYSLHGYCILMRLHKPRKAAAGLTSTAKGKSVSCSAQEMLAFHWCKRSTQHFTIKPDTTIHTKAKQIYPLIIETKMSSGALCTCLMFKGIKKKLLLYKPSAWALTAPTLH